MSKEAKRVITEVLSSIVPSQHEEKSMKSAFSVIAKKIKIKGTKVLLGGSGAKGTWLKEAHDMDIYVAFNYARYKNQSDQIADILAAHLKKKFKNIVRLHGSRDYFHMYQGDYTTEIVPILNIKKSSQAKNITDCSQLHVTYVKKKKKLANDMRLAKAFAKSAGVYGAESYIQGFSGYVLEVLIITYGSFLNLLKAAAKWKGRTIIGEKKKVDQLNYAKKQSPLILIDPIQQERNAAAALGEDKYYDFILTARAFLKHPSPSLFRRRSPNILHLEHHGMLIMLAVQPHQGKQDVVGAQVHKLFQQLKQRLLDHDFTILKSGWLHDKPQEPSLVYFLTKKTPLLPTRTMHGPPTANIKAVEAFKKAHASTFIEGNRIYATERRKYTEATTLIRDAIKQPLFHSRVKNLQLL